MRLLLCTTCETTQATGLALVAALLISMYSPRLALMIDVRKVDHNHSIQQQQMAIMSSVYTRIDAASVLLLLQVRTWLLNE